VSWKCLGVGLLITTTSGIATAEEFIAWITRIEDGKVSFERVQEAARGAGQKGKVEVLSAASAVKVFQGKVIREGGKSSWKIERGNAEVPGGLGNELLKNVGRDEPGQNYIRIGALIITAADGKNITEMHVALPPGPPKKKPDK
jgi:hypothetical protein